MLLLLTLDCFVHFEQNERTMKLALRSKKHSRTSPEIQFKELNEKLRFTLPEQQINSTIPAKTKTKSSQKIENQTIKQTKQIYNP